MVKKKQKGKQKQTMSITYSQWSKSIFNLLERVY